MWHVLCYLILQLNNHNPNMNSPNLQILHSLLNLTCGTPCFTEYAKFEIQVMFDLSYFTPAEIQRVHATWWFIVFSK